MSMVRTPLRLPEEISNLIAENRGDVGLNVWLVRACAERLVRDGLLSAEDAEKHIGTMSGAHRRRPAVATAWGRK